jgi:hypothetical protein
MALYLGVKSENGLAFARTGAYTWSIAVPIWALGKAGERVAATEREF